MLFTRKKEYKELATILGYYPRKWHLYRLAFIHRSASVVLKDGSTVNNERLEFLGDAVLDTIVAEFLFTHYPAKDEGFLSKMRSKIVKRKHLNYLAINLGISKLIVSNSIKNSAGKHICGNAFEALVGAVYIDKGYNRTKKFIIKNVLDKYIDLDDLEHRETDYKSRIIEWAQKNKSEISFDCEEAYSGKSNEPFFIAKVLLSNEMIGEGTGASKKEAEQNASEIAYIAIHEL